MNLYRNSPHKPIFLLVILIVLSNIKFINSQIQGIFETQGSCRVLLSDILRREFRNINACVKELELNKTGPRKKYMMSNCIIKCAMVKEGLLNENGLSEDNLLESFMQRVPTFLEKRARNATATCKELAVKLDPKEEMCSSYQPLVDCVRYALLHMCNTR